MYPVVPFQFDVEKQQRPTRPQDPIVLVLSPPWRTVLVIVIERFACMASTRLALRPTNRRSPTRGSCSLSPSVYPLQNSRPNLAEIAPMPIPTDAERLNFCTETKETTPHEFDLWCWQRYISPTTGSAVLVTPPHHGEAIASKIREHLPSLSCVTSWSAIAAMQTATGNATEQCDEPTSR